MKRSRFSARSRRSSTRTANPMSTSRRSWRSSRAGPRLRTRPSEALGLGLRGPPSQDGRQPEIEDQREADEDEHRAAEKRRRDGLAEEQDAPEHAEDRVQERHRAG